MALEKIVRPYQTRVNTPPIKLEISTNIDAQPIELRFGSKGSGKTLTGNYTSSLSVYQEKAAVEKTDGQSKLQSPPQGGDSFEGGV
jgi:hypothetical protein